jgi:hypothetical protein
MNFWVPLPFECAFLQHGLSRRLRGIDYVVWEFHTFVVKSHTHIGAIQQR